MKILAIYPYMHISSSAIIINGKIVCASPEERFNRNKMSTDFPSKSIEWCLKYSNLKWSDIDIIAVPWNPGINIKNSSDRWLKTIRWRGELLSNIPSQIMKMQKDEIISPMEIKWNNNRVIFFNHHECHAAYSLFQSPFKNADIITIDGHGEIESCFIGYNQNNKIIKKFSVNYPHSLGLFYGTITEFLGFKPDSDEWKVMALQSFNNGKNIYQKKMDSLIKKTNNGFELDLSYFNYYLFDKQKHFYSKKFENLFGPKRNKDEKLKLKHYQIASALQKKFTEILLHLIKISKKNSKNKNLIISGGAAMNSVANGLLDNISDYKDTWIGYAPDDSGVAIGAGLLANYKFSKKPRVVKEIKTNYFGPGFSFNETERILKKNKIDYIKPKNIYNYAATEISKGKLIGLFQNKMEFGHRALGNRSIIADPRNPKIKDTINKAVKYRESFRPFAPAVLEEHQQKIFKIRKKRKVYFMERVYEIKKSWQNKIPAVTHTDGTGRIQTVSKSTNLNFYKYIQEFYKITNIPILLNTSFNVNGEPIVMTPEDAIRTFYSCGLDILILDKFVITK